MHPVAILSTVFCVIGSLLMFVSDVIGDHMVETYSSMGFVMALYVARIVSFCFPHVVDMSALSICIVFRAFVVVIYMCVSVCMLTVSNVLVLSNATVIVRCGGLFWVKPVAMVLLCCVVLCL